MKLWKRQEFLY